MNTDQPNGEEKIMKLKRIIAYEYDVNGEKVPLEYNPDVFYYREFLRLQEKKEKKQKQIVSREP